MWDACAHFPDAAAEAQGHVVAAQGYTAQKRQAGFRPQDLSDSKASALSRKYPDVGAARGRKAPLCPPSSGQRRPDSITLPRAPRPSAAFRQRSSWNERPSQGLPGPQAGQTPQMGPPGASCPQRGSGSRSDQAPSRWGCGVQLQGPRASVSRPPLSPSLRPGIVIPVTIRQAGLRAVPAGLSCLVLRPCVPASAQMRPIQAALPPSLH